MARFRRRSSFSRRGIRRRGYKSSSYRFSGGRRRKRRGLRRVLPSRGGIRL